VSLVFNAMTGIEPFVDPLAGGLVGILVDTAKKVGGGFAQVVGDRAKAAAALRQYADKYANRYGEVRFLGMRQGIPLEGIYTKVRFLDELSICSLTSLKALEQNYRKTQKQRFQAQKTAGLDSSTIVNENQFLMVLGKPGSGKSTFLRRTGLEALKGEKGSLRHRCIPVLLELKRFNTNEIDLTKAIADELSNFGFPETETFTLKLLEQGKLLLLMDGLDEVPIIHQDAVIGAIQGFFTRYDSNRYIASCRIAAYQSAWNRFQDIELADFDDDQIQQFICNWFQSEANREVQAAERFWESLNDPNNVAAKELAHTPLLLTLLCRIYKHEQKLPSSQATLYRKALDHLLEDWAKEKKLQQDPIYQRFSNEVEKDLLSQIAYQGSVNDQVFFTQEELIEQIKDYLSDIVDKPKYLNGKAILDAISIQQGILIERAEYIFSFSHLAFQEYLTAQYIGRDSSLIRNSLEQNLDNLRWREIFILIAGLLRCGDTFLELMEERLLSYNYLKTPKLRGLAKWVVQAVDDSEEKCRSATKRAAIYVFIGIIFDEQRDGGKPHSYRVDHLLNALSPSLFGEIWELGFPVSDINFVAEDGSEIIILNDRPVYPDQMNKYLPRIHDKPSLEFACDLVRKFEENKIFRNIDCQGLIFKLEALQDEAPIEIPAVYADDDEGYRFYINRIRQVWLESLEFQEEWLDLPYEESYALANYLYISELMVRCKEAAIQISREVWQGIEERMLVIMGSEAT